MTANQRKSIRTPFQATVSLSNDDIKPLTVKVQDVSDGGVLINLDGQIELCIGTVLNVQMLGMPFEAPIREMTVVRLEAGCAGLKFVENFD